MATLITQTVNGESLPNMIMDILTSMLILLHDHTTVEETLGTLKEGRAEWTGRGVAYLMSKG